MLIRYRKTEDGKTVAKALVYTKNEHKIDRSRVDPDALRIVERLRENGHEAYIVGGAVRDLLLGRRPKDFDIVTDAEPPRIKRVFRNARVIGRRFRLVHVYAGPKIFEVSTFRSIANGTVGNEYGTIDEDAMRRDFSCNALYYDPLEDQLVDYVGGFKDVAARRLVPVIPLKTIFQEDPVRMIRALKYAATTGLRIPFFTRRALRRDAALLADASPSRLTEEFQKILASGKSASIIKSLADYELLRHILPAAAELLERDQAFRKALYVDLEELDAYASDPTKEKRLSLLIAHYLKPFLETRPGMVADTSEAYQNAVHEARLFLHPLNPPRVELEAAVLVVFKKRGISPLQKPRRGAPARGRDGGEKTRLAEGRGLDARGGEARETPESSRSGRGRKRPAAEPAAPSRKNPPVEKRASLNPEEALPSDEGPSAPAKRRRRRKPGTPSPEGREPQASEQPPRPEAESGPRLSSTSGAARRRRKRNRKPSEGGEGSAPPAAE